MTPFEIARAEERRNRLLAYLARAPRLCGLPVVPITARHLLELEVVGNACVVPGTVTTDAVFDFLWRLHPDFCVPQRPELLARGGEGLSEEDRLTQCFGHPPSASAYLQVHGVVAKLPLAAAYAEIKARISLCYQDQAADVTDGMGLKSALAPDRHWLESFLVFYCVECGWSVDAVLDSPLARLFQIYREHCLAHGIEAPFVAPSDALIGAPPGSEEPAAMSPVEDTLT